MYEQIQSHQITGVRGSYGIERQLWDTPHGVRERYAVTVPRAVPGNQCAAERTIHDTEAQARDVSGTRLPEPLPGVLWTDGRLAMTWEHPEIEERLRLAEDLARWAGNAAEREHDEAVASLPEGRHYTYCCMQAREDGARNEYAFAMALPMEGLRRRHAAELEDRAVERARREGVLR